MPDGWSRRRSSFGIRLRTRLMARHPRTLSRKAAQTAVVVACVLCFADVLLSEGASRRTKIVAACVGLTLYIGLEAGRFRESKG